MLRCRTILLFSMVALLGCDAASETTIRLDVDYDDAWAITSLEVSTPSRTVTMDPGPEVLIHLPNDVEEAPIEIVVWGNRGETRYAGGRASRTPERGAEVRASVTLTRLSCGAWCTEGAVQCEGDGVARCERDDDGCLEWSAPFACPSAAPSCSLGECRTECIDECADGDRECAGPAGVRLCGQADSDPCLDWLAVSECAEGETCSAGECRTECQGECADGAVSCRGGGVSRCGDRDLDGCTEWGPVEPCGTGETCGSGACRPIESCEDECDVNECEGLVYRQCGNYDLDPCLELSPGTSCTATETCAEPRCNPAAGCEMTSSACDTPPPATCIDDSTLRVYETVGSCSSGTCEYPSREQACPSCPDCDACAGVTCDTPPSVCYAATGTCELGACNYAFADAASCDDGDACTTNDACTSGDCRGTARTCASPPAPICEGNVLRTYASVGTCSGGECTYASASETCAFGCSAGACDADPCSGLACDTPPSICYVALGTCSGGECSYAFNDGASCDDGNLLTSADSCDSGVCAGSLAWVEITTGEYNTCARTESGAVVCWGSGGSLGDGTVASRSTPMAAVTGLSDAVEITAGRGHACARRESGAVVCWGGNAAGQLGDGTRTDRLTLAGVVGLSDAAEISAGTYHTCARRSSGAVVCWGENPNGQLGDGTMTTRLTPRTVTGLTDAVEITTGRRHTCARRASGAVVCWGSNASRQLGDGTLTDRLTPRAVTGLSDAVEITAGEHHTCARRSSGAVVCWGDNANGQLGDGTTLQRGTPTAVMGLSDAVEIDAGTYHTCARRSSGAVVCWGEGGAGQRGDGTETDQPVPLPVTGLSGAVELSTDGLHTCARRSSGQVMCWGWNRDGQLGDGTTTDRLTPTLVLLP